MCTLIWGVRGRIPKGCCSCGSSCSTEPKWGGWNMQVTVENSSPLCKVEVALWETGVAVCPASSTHPQPPPLLSPLSSEVRGWTSPTRFRGPEQLSGSLQIPPSAAAVVQGSSAEARILSWCGHQDLSLFWILLPFRPGAVTQMILHSGH
jgi:hypothetical protein